VWRSGTCPPTSSFGSGLFGQTIQKLVQSTVSGVMGRPIRAIAAAGNLDAHGFAPALDFPAERTSTITAARHDDEVSSVPVIGMHTRLDARLGRFAPGRRSP
jgi:hypothetical protein